VLGGRISVVVDGERVYKVELSDSEKRADLPPLPDEKPQKRGS